MPALKWQRPPGRATLRIRRLRHVGDWFEAERQLWTELQPKKRAVWGIRGKMNATPRRRRTAFRDDSEQDSGMKVNTDSARKPNTFRPTTESRSASPGMISTS